MADVPNEQDVKPLLNRADNAEWHGRNMSHFSKQIRHLHKSRRIPHRKFRRRVCGERGLPPLDGDRHDDLRTPQQDV